MTKGSWREEPWWHWDWPGRPDPRVQSTNGIHDLQGQDQPRGDLASKIVIPDIESRRGWREWWIYRDSPIQNQRKLGL